MARLSLLDVDTFFDIVDLRRQQRPCRDLPQLGVPHFLYNHLVINDYLAQRLPEPMVVCPEDTLQIQRQRDLALDWSVRIRSSYLTVSCVYAMDTRKEPSKTTLGPAGNFITLTSGNMPLATRRVSDIAFPSQKVIMMDLLGRHGPELSYYAYDDVVQPLLFGDSSVRNTQTGACNKGADPNQPQNQFEFTLKYIPSLMQGAPPTRSGENADNVLARYQWTRNGLRGVDINAQDLLPK